MDIGGKIRQIRTEKSLTIKQLAELVACTPSLISQLERGKADPSISTLKKISSALNANIVDFFMTATADDDIVTHVKERVDIHLKRWDTKIQSLIKRLGNKKMQPFYTTIKPGGGSHGMYTHEGEEFGIVLKGELELIINEKVHVVRENESFYFTSQTPHNWNNKSKEDAIVVWVITPPTF